MLLRPRVLAFAVAVATVAGSGHAGAQAGGHAVFRGRVTTNLGTEPVADAEIVFREAARSVRSGVDGRFILTGLPAGDYNVIVRHAGFTPINGKVHLADTDTITYPGPFDLVPVKQELMPVDVRARADIPALRAFEARRASTNGKFLTADDIRKTGSTSLANIITTKVSGFQVARQGAVSVLVNRRIGRPDANGRNTCFTAIWLNGQIYYSPENGGTPPELEEFNLQEIAAIEFYRVSEVPPELQFRSGSCGVMVLWTQVRERKP